MHTLFLARRVSQIHQHIKHYAVEYCKFRKKFARVLFSRNFAYAKFRENKILPNWPIHSVRNTIRVSNRLDPDLVWPDLGSNCLQRLSAELAGRVFNFNIFYRRLPQQKTLKRYPVEVMT